MPLYEYRCEHGHLSECYFALALQAGDEGLCRTCGLTAVRLFPTVNMLQYFSENNGRIIQNLAPGQPIHSHGEHQRLMKDKGLEPATDWHVSMKQTDGLKTTAQPPHPSAKLRG